jgi:hypothetical protein
MKENRFIIAALYQAGLLQIPFPHDPENDKYEQYDKSYSQ